MSQDLSLLQYNPSLVRILLSARSLKCEPQLRARLVIEFTTIFWSNIINKFSEVKK